MVSLSSFTRSIVEFLVIKSQYIRKKKSVFISIVLLPKDTIKIPTRVIVNYN